MPAAAGSRWRIRLVIEPTSFQESRAPLLYADCDFRNDSSQRAKVGTPREIRPRIGQPARAAVFLLMAIPIGTAAGDVIAVRVMPSGLHRRLIVLAACCFSAYC